jgi:hypothetical protein
MMNSLGTLQSIANYSPNAPPPSGSVSVTSISGNYALNDSQFALSGKSVYKFYNSTTPSSVSSITNQTGSFTISVSGASKTIYFLICAGGSSGSSGNQGAGGSSSGDLLVSSVSLPIGTYNCTYQIGGSCTGCYYVASGSYIGPNQNGWGSPGGDSNFVCNGTTYTTRGGLPGAPSGYSASSLTSSFSSYPLGSGAATSIGHGALSGYTGTKKNGGNTPTSTACSSASGGASVFESGANGVETNFTSGNPAPGSIGGRATRSIDLSAPWNGFSSTQYFCEASAGTACRTSPTVGTSYPATAGYYGFAGSSSGTSANCTDAVVNSNGGYGSAGGSSFQLQGRNGTYYGGSGTNGLFLLAF